MSEKIVRCLGHVFLVVAACLLMAFVVVGCEVSNKGKSPETAPETKPEPKKVEPDNRKPKCPCVEGET